jgi:hypothetical protein
MTEAKQAEETKKERRIERALEINAPSDTRTCHHPRSHAISRPRPNL